MPLAAPTFPLKEDGALRVAVVGIGVTLNVAVSVVGASVIVSVPAADPSTRLNVAAVLLVTEGVPDIEAPVPPETEKSVDALSDDQSVFVPVAVTVVVWPVLLVVGLIVKLAAFTVSDELTRPSTVMVNVPVPAPVVTVRVAAVPLLWVHVPSVTIVVPVTEFWTVTVEPLVQLVPVPVRVSVMLPEWLAGMAAGEAVNDPPGVAAQIS